MARRRHAHRAATRRSRQGWARRLARLCPPYLHPSAPLGLDRSRRNARVDAAGFADDEVGGEDDAAGAAAGLAGDALEEELGAEAAEGLGGLVDDGEEGRQHGEVLDVVEAD